MNEKLKKIRDELSNLYSNCANGKYSIANSLEWCISKSGFIEGFTAAEPHIRRDERERVLELLDRYLAYNLDVISEPVKWLKNELKKMDEDGG